MAEAQIEINVLGSLSEIEPEDWDACATPESADGGRPIDPFTTWRFLNALERSGSVGPGTGWAPRYLCALADGKTIAVAPLYAKGHSQGEYVFDHNWAHAFEQAGGFRGFYFVLHGRLSPLDGIGPDELRLDLLTDRVLAMGPEELIIATNPTVEGEATAHYISRALKEEVPQMSRIAHGVPLGGEIEYTDGGTLAHALQGRRSIH